MDRQVRRRVLVPVALVNGTPVADYEGAQYSGLAGAHEQAGPCGEDGECCEDVVDREPAKRRCGGDDHVFRIEGSWLQ